MAMNAAVLEGSLTYSSTEVCALVGVTYRQLDHWVRLGHVPGFDAKDISPGSGQKRRYTPEQLEAVRDLKRAYDLKNAPVNEVLRYIHACDQGACAVPQSF